MKIPLIFLFSLVLIPFISCTTGKNSNSDKQNMENTEKTFWTDGKIIKQNFVNKIGVENPDIYDLYLELNDTLYFIKSTEKSVTTKILENYIDKKTSCKIEKEYGLWDTDNPNVQSRVGNYVIIYEIK